jgi:hypothetical protein
MLVELINVKLAELRSSIIVTYGQILTLNLYFALGGKTYLCKITKVMFDVASVLPRTATRIVKLKSSSFFPYVRDSDQSGPSSC